MSKKTERCLNCFEKMCICQYEACAVCGEDFLIGLMYEYRGVMGCSACFDTLTQKRDEQRERVMEQTETAIRLQQDGEWMNGGFRTMAVSGDGKPLLKDVKEPLGLQDYEKGKL